MNATAERFIIVRSRGFNVLKMYEYRPSKIVPEEDCLGFSGKKPKVELSTEEH